MAGEYKFPGENQAATLGFLSRKDADGRAGKADFETGFAG
jgi:hypothetical protein